MLAVAGRATRLRTRVARDLSRLGKISLLVWALVCSGYYPRPPFEMGLVYATCVAALVGLVAIGWSLHLRSGRALAPAHAGVSNERMWIELGTKRFDFDVARDVTSALAFGEGSEIQTRDGDVWGFVHASPEEAAAFVDALGFGANGRRATFDMALPPSLSHRIASAFVSFILASFVTFPLGVLHLQAFASAAMLVVASLLYALFRWTDRKPIVTAGVDGVAIHHRGRTRFVPASAIVGASTQPSGHAMIVRRDAKPVEIDGPNEFRQAALAARVEALSKHEAPEAPVALERAGRSVREWRAHLRDAIAGGYRAAAGSLDAFADQLASRVATPEQRVGAALALRVADADQGAARVRVAAECCVDPRLREALEAAAALEVDDDALDRALSRLAKSRSGRHVT